MSKIPNPKTALVLAAALVLALAGCSENAGRTAPGAQQGVAETLQEQAGEADDGAVSDKAAGGTCGFAPDTSPAFPSVDYDLTAMGSEMVYATVYDMMVDPAAYEGKTVRMEGPYYHTHYDATGKDYFYVIIQDATACCAQGIEFVWGDGSRTWPEDYPEDGHGIVVTGTFEPYTEGTVNYVHLVGASVEDA